MTTNSSPLHFAQAVRWVSVAALVLAACGPGGSAGGVARSARPREQQPVVPGDALGELSAGNRAFALDLYHAISQQDGNLFFSPYSLSLVLTMAYAGARGETERQMETVLHYPLPQAQLHPAFNALDLSLASAGKGDESFKLKLANALWGQQDFPLAADYLDVLAANYGAGMQLADFKDDGQREAARQAINRWVDDQTESRIKELIDKGVLTKNTRLVLANAIYFKAQWDQPFHAEDKPVPFHLADGGEVAAPAMSRRGQTAYAAGPDYQAVELAYKGGRMSMLIVLPATGQFQAFEAALDGTRFDAILQALQPTDLKLYLPTFQYSASLSLAETLASMGMPDVFDWQKADFSGMDGRRDLVVSHVLHKAFVAVDELGTEAAAASGLVAEIVSMPEVMTVDRPFLLFIRDGETGTLLFAGRVMNPVP